MKKIEGGSYVHIESESLFEKSGFNIKKRMLYIRLCALCAIIILTAVITVLISSSVISARGDDGGEMDTVHRVEMPDRYEETESDGKENTPPSDVGASGGGVNREYIDCSQKELGEIYVKNYSGNAVVYDPYAKYEKYYNSNSYAPLVLILHTESDGKYYGDTDNVTSVVDLGERLCRELNLLGIASVHCSAIHQSAIDTDSYNNAEESIAFYLAMYPSIKYIFDIGALDEEYATGGTFERKTCSQILFEVCGKNRDTVGINLALSIKLRGMLNRDEMSVAREIILSDSVLNSRYTPYYLTLKVGTKANSTEESKLAIEAFALAFVEYLNKQ